MNVCSEYFQRKYKSQYGMNTEAWEKNIDDDREPVHCFARASVGDSARPSSGTADAA